MSSDHRPLLGRTAFVTGASSGLGTHFSRVLAQAGANVAVAARRIAPLEALVAEIERGGGRAAAIPMDVTDEASVQSGFSAAEAALGPIDSVIANAGISAAGLAVNINVADFDRIMAVNVRGTFLTAREAARRGIERGASNLRIVLIASIGGLKALPALTTYSASKAAVVMMGQGLAREWINKGTTVNVLCPGYVRTDLNGEWFDSPGGNNQIAGFPRRRLMKPEALNDLLLFLAGDASDAVTGSVFKVDDGQTL
jgi:NAD(P)-dependent dehydrogenase (short-subunit alcohol dehydrogenase family)